MAYNYGVVSEDLIPDNFKKKHFELQQRFLSLPKNQSFFLFGPRGSGKSTLINNTFTNKTFSLNLLDPILEEKLQRNPKLLIEMINAADKSLKYVFIDEVQKIPKLLDLVHLLIETTSLNFILTGSSARKLKHGGANLLAGRAFVYNLYPFSFFEIQESIKDEGVAEIGVQLHGQDTSLKQILEWGLLPKIFQLKSKEEKLRFLQSYSYTYLKEEIWAEQFIKNLDPFRYFLEVAAQMNGKILNFSNVARDTGVDDKTVKNYYSILEDTLIGFNLNPFNHSFRKRLNAKPKFYFFDTGVVRALRNILNVSLEESTSLYGETFEHFIILEVMKLTSCFKPDYRLSYLMTKDNAEIDLVVERPGKKYLFIEIKSSNNVSETHLNTLAKLSEDFNKSSSQASQAICFSNDEYKRKLANGVMVYPWREGLRKYFWGKA